jgi:hypothetical protein
MYLNKKAIKAYFKGHDKQLSKEAWQALEDCIPLALLRVINNTGHFKRVKETEVYLAFGKDK